MIIRELDPLTSNILHMRTMLESMIFYSRKRAGTRRFQPLISCSGLQPIIRLRTVRQYSPPYQRS